ncbi:MAG: hypothetical protein ACQEWV_15370 [Bacillota bacterium]
MSVHIWRSSEIGSCSMASNSHAASNPIDLYYGPFLNERLVSSHIHTARVLIRHRLTFVSIFPFTTQTNVIINHGTIVNKDKMKKKIFVHLE